MYVHVQSGRRCAGICAALQLTESGKYPVSITESNKQWVGTCLYQEWCKPLLISCEAAFGYEQVAKRIANIRLTHIILGSKGILAPTDAYELLRCEAAPAILQAFEIR